MFRGKLNKSIRLKFLIILAFVLFVGTLATSIVIAINEGRVLKNSLVTRGQSFASYIARLSKDPLVMKDSIQLDAIVNDANKDEEDIVYSIIYDADGIPLTSQYASINFHLPRLHHIFLELSKDSEMKDIIDAIKKEEPVTEISTPIMIGVKTVGAITIGMSEHRIHQEVVRNVLFVVALNLAVTVVLVIILFVASKKIVFDPLIELTDTSVRLGHGDLKARTGLDRTEDELGQAIKAFDEMAETLERKESERKQSEQDRAMLTERLQRSEKMEALGTLAGGVAHDLNNVLGIVVGYSEMVLDEVDEASRIKPHVVNIMQAGRRAAAIVQDLLTLARRGVYSPKVISLNDIVLDYQQSLEFERLHSFHDSVQIRVNLETNLLNIVGSPVHLGKMIMNLVSNAAEAMPDGGIVSIVSNNQYVDKPLAGYDNVQEGDYVVLSVSDTGKGIAAADLKHIFEPFYTKKVMGRSGTGLGLSVVWGTVKDHNGYINVESKEGQGTIFTLYFPATRQEISKDGLPASISEYMGDGESILVVDDIEGQRELAALILTKLNYAVATAASGEGAVEYLRTNKADVVVLDMIMDPGLDGLDTYRKILEIRPEQKAIIVSGFSESDRVKAAQSLGAGAYVRKPYVMENLGLAVRKELDRKQVTANS